MIKCRLKNFISRKEKDYITYFLTLLFLLILFFNFRLLNPSLHHITYLYLELSSFWVVHIASPGLSIQLKTFY
jgi:hypothetical protein